MLEHFCRQCTWYGVTCLKFKRLRLEISRTNLHLCACSTVKCMACAKVSDTFDPLLDISVDIKNSTTLNKALLHYIKPDLLEGDNSYACP